MYLEVFEDTYWLLAEIVYLARNRMINNGRMFDMDRYDLANVWEFMQYASQPAEVSNDKLYEWSCSFARLSSSFAHGAIVRFEDGEENAEPFMWASRVLEFVAVQLNTDSGQTEDTFSDYESSISLTQTFREDGYTRVPLDMMFS